MGVTSKILASVGAATLVVLLSNVAVAWTYEGATGVVEGPDGTPLTGVPVFLDRRRSQIERFVTDSTGRFALPLRREELGAAVWLICAPGGVPMLGTRGLGQIGPTHYGYTPMPPDGGWVARPRGWAGPMPRECPQTADPAYRWHRSWPGAQPWEEVSREEPDWSRAPESARNVRP